MNRHPKQKLKPSFRSVFIVDPVKSERLQLAKLLKQEKIFMMTFTNLMDCFKHNHPIKPDLVINVLRKDKNEPTYMKNIKKPFKHLHFILLLTSKTYEKSLDELKESGFTSVHKAMNQDMIKEIIYSLMPECQMSQAEEPSVQVK